MVMPDLGSLNYVDFGARGTIFAAGSDEARFQRYRDLRNGPTLDVFRYASDTDARGFTVKADHVGYRDQRYAASYNGYGKLKFSVEWNQIPLFYSQDTATLFTLAVARRAPDRRRDSRRHAEQHHDARAGGRSGTARSISAVSATSWR